MDIHIYHHIVDSWPDASGVNAKLDTILEKLQGIANKEVQMSEQLDTLTATVTSTETVIDSAITLIGGLAAQIAAIKDDPVKLQALSDELNAKKDALAAAVAANTVAG